MKKLLLLSALLIFACSSDDNDSLFMITNNTNEDFIINHISFMGYEFSDLNIQYGESQTYNLSDGLSGSSSNININIGYLCDTNVWNSTFNIDLIEGSTTSYEFIPCASISPYCIGVCLEQI